MKTDEIHEHARQLHQSAIVIDAHSDILMAIADGIVRLSEPLILPDPANWVAPVKAIPVANSATGGFNPSPLTEYFGPAGLYSLPQLKAGGVTLQVCAIYLEDRQLDRALQRGLEMTWWLNQEALDNPDFELVKQVEDIHRLKQEGKVGGLLAFEGLEALGSELRFLDLYYQLGLRMVSMTHNRRNLFADGPQPGVKTGGLTDLGRQAVKRMNDLGIVIDLVHTNEPCYWEILELNQAPVVISHLSPYAFGRWRGQPWPVPHFNPSLDQSALEAIKKTGGVAGLIYYGFETLDDVVDSIEQLLDMIGPDHVGLGSDFYGLERSPKGLEDISRTPRITEALVTRGYSDEVILKVLGGNFIRVFEQVWKK